METAGMMMTAISSASVTVPLENRYNIAANAISMQHTILLISICVVWLLYAVWCLYVIKYQAKDVLS